MCDHTPTPPHPGHCKACGHDNGLGFGHTIKCSNCGRHIYADGTPKKPPEPAKPASMGFAVLVGLAPVAIIVLSTILYSLGFF